MANSSGADIIPFPVRQATAQAAPGSDRLSNALTALSVAMAEQQTAIARWRKAVEDLSASMKRLGRVDTPDVTPRAS